MSKGRSILRFICILGVLLLFINIVPFNTKATETTNESTEVPAYAYSNSNITDIVIEEGVTKICDFAFHYCTDLTSITLPKSLIKIGDQVFGSCEQLMNVYYNGTIEDWCKIDFSSSDSNPMRYAEHFYMLDENNEYYEVTEIEIPSTIVRIKTYQFYGFDNLRNVTIPEGVKVIEANAFNSCTKLSTITLPSTLRSIDNSALSETNIYKVVNKSECNIGFYYSSILQVVIDRNGNPTYRFGVTECIEFDDFVFILEDDGYKLLTYIGNDEYVVLPESINGERYEINYLPKMKNVIISKGVSSIASEALKNWDDSVNVYFTGSIQDWNNIEMSKDYDWEDECNPLYYTKNFYMLDEKNEYYKVNELTLPKNITIDNSNAFLFFVQLDKIYYEGTIEDWCNARIDAFYTPMKYAEHIYMLDENNEYYEVKEIVIPDTITSINNYQFSGFKSCESIIIPNSITKIDYDAFSYCSNLKNVYFNGTIEDWCKIDFSSFYSNPMYYAEHIYMLDENNEYCEVTDITIPDTITKIGDYQFNGFDKCSTITISSSVTSIGYNAFCNCNIIKIINNSDINITFSQYNNGYIAEKAEVIIDKNGNASYKNESSTSDFIEQDGLIFELYNGTYKLVSYVGKEEVVILPLTINGENYLISSPSGIKHVILPEGLEKINSFSFNECQDLLSVTIPSSITSIENYAFENCYNLINVYYNGTIEDWCSIKFGTSSYARGVNPMEYAENFYLLDSSGNYYIPTKLEIKNNITKIDDKGCEYLKNIEEIILPETVTTVGKHAFYGCKNLKSIVLPKSLVNIGDDAFYGCDSLENIYYNGTIEDWCNIEFNYSNHPFYVNQNYTNIRFYLLDENGEYDEITKLVIPSSVTEIGAYQFAGFSFIEEVIFPETVISIGEYAFEGCKKLTRLEMPKSVTNISRYAFYRCESLTEIDSFDYVEHIDNYAFAECVSLKGLLDLKNVKIIGWKAFSSCKSITELIINDEVESIGAYAFSGCNSLVRVTLPFIGPTADTKDDATICYIFDDDSFGLWSMPSSIKEIVLTKETKLNDYAFPMFCDIEKITLPETLEYISSSAFYRSSNLIEVNIPSSVTEIEGNPFMGCNSIENIIIGDESKYEFVDNVLIDTDTNSVIAGFKDAIIPDYITSINEEAFYSIEIGNLTIPENVTYIGDSAFAYADYLVKINIPESVTSVGQNIFLGCTVLDEIYVDSEQVASSIDNKYFGNYLNVDNPFIYIKSDLSVSSYVDNRYYKYNTVIINGVEYIEYSTHLLTFVDECEPLCLIDGHTEHRYCEECSYHTEYDIIPALGEHAFGDWKEIISATHDDCGMEIKSCKNCPETKFREIPALGHSYVSSIIDPTCIKEGYTIHICECGDSYITDVVNALGHSQVIDKEVLPTCTDTGLTAGAHCSSCNEVIIAQVLIPALGHSYGEWVIVREATDTNTGLKEKVCSVCNDKITEEIPLLEHTHSYGDEYSYDDKEHYYECICGDKKDIAKHSFDNGVVTKEATFDEKGKIKYSCTECDYEYEVETPILEKDNGCKSVHWILLLLLLVIIICICLYYKYRTNKREKQENKN